MVQYFDRNQLKELQKQTCKLARRLRLCLLLEKPFYVALRSIKLSKNKGKKSNKKKTIINPSNTSSTLPATGSSALAASTSTIDGSPRIHELKANLSAVQKGNSSISEYVDKIKGIADALASLLEPVSDLELVCTTLRGLGDDWINIYAAINFCSTLPKFSEFCALLLQSNSSNIQDPSSFFAGSSNYNGTGGRISGFSNWKNGNDAKMLRTEFVKPEIISWAPRIIVLHNFLSSKECDYLIKTARPRLQVSLVGDGTGKGITSNNRTSYGMSLSKQESDKHPILQAIEKRISVFSQVPVENGERFQILRYEKDQYYRLHRDYFQDTDTVNLNMGGQRIATMLMYLNDGFEGGETYFPKAGTGECSCAGKMLTGSSVKPIKGDAVLFWNMGLDGKMDPNSWHTGCEVLSGEKWCATKWMRERTYTG